MDHLGILLRRRAGPIRWVALAIVLISLMVIARLLMTEQLLQTIEARIEKLGVWGPLALYAIYVIASLLLFPGSVITLIAGAVYGLAWGMVIVSAASTTVAALAFLIARYAARDRVRRTIERSPQLEALDRAIGEQGWKIVALLRLSPAIPFNLQNYLYGVTAIGFWPCVLVSWLAMLPGTLMYIYLGSLGRAAVAGRETSMAEWALRAVGLVATVAVTLYLARLARQAIRQYAPADDENARTIHEGDGTESDWPWKTAVIAGAALLVLVLAIGAFLRRDAVKQSIDRWLTAKHRPSDIGYCDARKSLCSQF